VLIHPGIVTIPTARPISNFEFRISDFPPNPQKVLSFEFSPTRANHQDAKDTKASQGRPQTPADEEAEVTPGSS
jgi:hypothetical protein